MELKDLYDFVILLVLIGMVIGIGLLILDKFAQTSGMSSSVVTAINNTIKAIAEIPNTWLGLIVTIVVLVILLGLVIYTVAGKMQKR